MKLESEKDIPFIECIRCQHYYQRRMVEPNLVHRCCRECSIKIGGERTWANICQYVLNKEYFKNIVLRQLKLTVNYYKIKLVKLPVKKKN